MCFGPIHTPTDEERRTAFVRSLAIALNTGVFADARYCDPEANSALCDIAASWPNATPELVDSAWTAFEGQFNGANRAKRQAEWDAEIARCMERAGWPESNPRAEGSVVVPGDETSDHQRKAQSCLRGRRGTSLSGMNPIQRRALSRLCFQYGVEFKESDYFVYPRTSSKMAGWAEGWIGGNDGRKLYVRCDPRTGQVHS